MCRAALAEGAAHQRRVRPTPQRVAVVAMDEKRQPASDASRSGLRTAYEVVTVGSTDAPVAPKRSNRPRKRRPIVKVCIVGASGKLGHYMIEHCLERGYEAVGVCREESVGKLDAYRD